MFSTSTADCNNTAITKFKITRREPTAIIWQNPGCGGARADIGAGQYGNLQQIRDEYNPALTNISGIWLPPNMYMDAYSNENDPYKDPEDWIRSAPFGTFEAGFYPDLSNPQINDIPRNTIKSFNIDRRKRWDEHLRNCCTGKSINGASPEVCGDWWGKGTHGAECDELMDAICGHPGLIPDKRCSCYSQPLQPDDTSDMAMVRTNPICYSQQCNIYGYIPSTLNRSTCPPVTVCQTTTTDLTNMTSLVTTRDCNQTNVPIVNPPITSNTTGNTIVNTTGTNNSTTPPSTSNATPPSTLPTSNATPSTSNATPPTVVSPLDSNASSNNNNNNNYNWIYFVLVIAAIFIIILKPWSTEDKLININPQQDGYNNIETSY